jgi:hypothetical protein
MTPLQPNTGPVGQYLPKPSLGRKLVKFSKRDLLSQRKMNELIDSLNALLNPSVNPPGAGSVLISDSNWVLDLSRIIEYISTTDPGTGTTLTGRVDVYIVTAHGTGADTDYVFAHPSPTGSAVKILKPPLIRFSVATRNGVSYSTYSATDQTRIASAGGTVLTQYITPKYIAGDSIYVMSLADGTKIDMNADNRTFAAP